MAARRDGRSPGSPAFLETHAAVKALDARTLEDALARGATSWAQGLLQQ